MWDDWEEENDDYCTYRHQRRLSDPSANLNNFSRYAWRTKNSSDTASGSAGSKARSENEGLDSLANEVSEIEAGDLRDGMFINFVTIFNMLLYFIFYFVISNFIIKIFCIYIILLKNKEDFIIFYLSFIYFFK